MNLIFPVKSSISNDNINNIENVSRLFSDPKNKEIEDTECVYLIGNKYQSMKRLKLNFLFKFWTLFPVSGGFSNPFW